MGTFIDKTLKNESEANVSGLKIWLGIDNRWNF